MIKNDLYYQQLEIPNPAGFDPRPQPKRGTIATGFAARAGNMD